MKRGESERNSRGHVWRRELVRCIIDWPTRASVDTAGQRRLGQVFVGDDALIGGGPQGPLLCEATGDWSGFPVVAGPAEATALGNVLVQARGHGTFALPLAETRAVVASSVELGRYEPQ
jgi:rhamnulokinase